MCLPYWRCLCHCVDCDMTRFSSIFRKHRITLFGNVCESVKSQPTTLSKVCFSISSHRYSFTSNRIWIYMYVMFVAEKKTTEKNPNQEQGNGKTSSSSSMCNNKWCCSEIGMHTQHKYKLKRMYISDIKTHQKNMLHNVRCHSTHKKCSYTLVHLCDATFNAFNISTHTRGVVSGVWMETEKKTLPFISMEWTTTIAIGIWSLQCLFVVAIFLFRLLFPSSHSKLHQFFYRHTLTSLDSILCFHVLRNVAHTAIPNKTKMLSTNHTLLLLLIKLRCFRCGFYNFF